MNPSLLMICKDRFPLERQDISRLLIDNLAGRQWKVDIFCRSEESLAIPFIKRRPGVRVWVMTSLGNKRLFGRLLNLFIDRIRDGLAFLTTIVHRPDFVIARDDFLSFLTLWIASALSRSRVIFWMSFPMHLGLYELAERRRGMLRIVFLIRANLMSQLFRRFVLRNATHIFCQSKRMRQVLVDYGVPNSRLTALPMGFDAKRIEAVLRQRVDQPSPAENRARVCYLGTLARARRLDVLLQAISIVAASGYAVELVLIGGGDTPEDEKVLRNEIERLQILEMVTFSGKMAHTNALREASTCALAVSPVPTGGLFDVGTPTKLVEYLALGLPVVANFHPDHEEIMTMMEAGVLVEFEPFDFARGIIEVIANYDFYRDNITANMGKLVEARSYEHIEEKLYSTLTDLLPEM